MQWVAERGTRTVAPRYGMDGAAAAAPEAFNQSLFESLLQIFSAAGLEPDVLLELREVASVMAARLSPASWAAYGSHISKFVRFCTGRGLPFLPATKLTGLLYARFLAAEGTVKAATAQPYFSAVNTLHELFGFEKPCSDNPQLTSFRKGWARMQVQLTAVSELVLAFPADRVKVLYDLLPSLSFDAVRLRQVLFVVLAFCLILRPHSLLSVVSFTLCEVDGECVLQYKPLAWKGKVCLPSLAPVLQFPLAGLPNLRAAVQHLMRMTAAGHSSVWCLQGERHPTTPVAESWFAAVLRSYFPELVGVHTLYSLRRGGASAARAAGLDLQVIESFGGWSAGSSALRERYLDFAVAPSPSAMLFFGRMASSRVPLFKRQYFQSA